MNPKRILYEGLSFIRHFPSYYRQHIRNVARLYTSGLPGNAIFIDRSKYIVPPLSSSVTHAVWSHHTTFESGAAEDRIFRQLREGCSAFLDLGCAEGYYSAVFAVTADRPGRIVAIDLSPVMCKLHQEVAETNKYLSGQSIEWSVHQVAITDVEGNTTLGGGFGGGFVCWYDTDPNRPVMTTTLRSFLSQVGLTPDFVKIDIESYEYEVITSSIDYFAEIRPKLHLELHSQMMRERGVSPDRVMELLLKYYRITAAIPSNYRTAPISRIGLIPKLG